MGEPGVFAYHLRYLYEHCGPNAEWRRLEELYREKSDDELEVIADEAHQLTDLAQQILEREIASRGLAIRLRETPPPPPEPESEDNPEPDDFDPQEYELVPTERAWDREEARKIKNIYVDAGIPAYFGPELLEDVDQYKGSFDRGVEFCVREIDHQRAMAAIRYAHRDEPQSEEPKEQASDYRCPKCKSNEIVFEELEKESPGQPDYLSRFHWRCDACGHEWTDDGVEK